MRGPEVASGGDERGDAGAAAVGAVRAELARREPEAGLRLEDLRAEEYIGKGGYGLVKLVTHVQSGHQYALKCVDKAQLTPEDRVAMLREKRILEEIEHPFILKLVTAFHDAQSLYLLTELVAGGDLLDAVQSLGNVTREDTQFYVGSLILAFEYLHQKCIVYRDLKPENILLNRDGYMKLIDFGLAKNLGAPDATTTTIMGTPHFMAPEVLRGTGYGLASDLWALGVCMYELCVGELPFGHEQSDQYTLFRAILHTEPSVPPDADADAADLLLRWLAKDPRERQDRAPLAGAQRHAFFGGFPWQDLAQRRLRPPVVYPQDRFAERRPVDPDAERRVGKAVPWDSEF